MHTVVLVAVAVASTTCTPSSLCPQRKAVSDSRGDLIPAVHPARSPSLEEERQNHTSLGVQPAYPQC